MVYQFEVLNKVTHGNLISQIANGQRPAAFFRVGYGVRPIAMEQGMLNSWQCDLMSLEQAQQLGR